MIKAQNEKVIYNYIAVFYDVGYKQVIKYVLTKWLSLKTAIEQALKLYEGIKSYFLFESCSQARF